MNHIRISVLLLALVSLDSHSSFADESVHTRIDQLIAAKADGPLAAKAPDEEFLRRVYLDFAGRIPSLTETREFLADGAAAKRHSLVDRLNSQPTSSI